MAVMLSLTDLEEGRQACGCGMRWIGARCLSRR